MPFSSISIPGIAGWNSKNKTDGSPHSAVDLSAVSDGFGIPSVDDPDPFGVLALEQAGLEIKEAGTQSRPTSETFEFKPSPTSPLFRHSFQSLDSISRHGSVGRESVLRDPRRDSKRSMMSDHGTQTADLPSPPRSPRILETKPVYNSPLRQSFDIRNSQKDDPANTKRASLVDTEYSPLTKSKFEEKCEPTISVPVDQNDIDTSAKEIDDDVIEREDESKIQGPVDDDSSDTELDGEDDFELDEESITIIEEVQPAVQIVAQTITSPTAARAKVVNIPGRPPPAIPVRSPRRERKAASSTPAGEHLDVEVRDDSSSMYSPSPTQSQFDKGDDHSTKIWPEQTSMPDVETVLNNNATSSPEVTTNVNENVANTEGSDSDLLINEMGTMTLREMQPDEKAPVSEDISTTPVVASNEKNSGEASNKAILGNGSHQSSTPESSLIHLALGTSTSRHATPIGEMIRAGLDDDSEDEPELTPIAQPSTGPKSNVNQGHTSPRSTLVFSLAMPPTNPTQETKSIEDKPMNSISEKNPDAIVPESQVTQNNHSPGLASISSDENRSSRVQSSAHTEDVNETSSVSDYGDDQLKDTSEIFHSIPPTPSESSSPSSSVAGATEKAIQ